MAVADDPFTAILEATWAMLEANDGFTSIVKVKNRIKFDMDDPIKQNVSTADKPEVRLVPTSVGPDAGAQVNMAASNVSLVVFGMELQIATGQQHLIDATIAGKENVLRVMWEAYRACWAWRTHYTSMGWGDPAESFKVHRLRAGTASIGVLVEDLNRGIDGWSSLLNLEVAMNFAINVHE